MNDDDQIIAMARSIRDGGHWNQIDIINFGRLIAAAEREACAKVCDELHALNLTAHDLNSELIPAFPFDPDDCAAAIRARGDHEPI